MSTLDLEAIEKRIRAATPVDKWKAGIYYNDGGYPTGPYGRERHQLEADRDFIQHARADLESLLNVVREREDARAAPSCVYCSHPMVRWVGPQWQCPMTSCRDHGAVVCRPDFDDRSRTT